MPFPMDCRLYNWTGRLRIAVARISDASPTISTDRARKGGIWVICETAKKKRESMPLIIVDSRYFLVLLDGKQERRKYSGWRSFERTTFAVDEPDK